MSFLNIQIGGSCFAHNETRTKNFTGAPDADPNLLETENVARAHQRMYRSAIRMLEDFALETNELDEAAVRQEQLEARQMLDRERGDRPAPTVTDFDPDKIAGKEVPK